MWSPRCASTGGKHCLLVAFDSVIVLFQFAAPSVSGHRANAANLSLFLLFICGPLKQMTFKSELHCINLHLTHAKHCSFLNVIVLFMWTPHKSLWAPYYFLWEPCQRSTSYWKIHGVVRVYSWPLAWRQSGVCIHMLVRHSDAGGWILLFTLPIKWLITLLNTLHPKWLCLVVLAVSR